MGLTGNEILDIVEPVADAAWARANVPDSSLCPDTTQGARTNVKQRRSFALSQ